MSRYMKTPEQKAMVRSLTADGFVVLREGSYRRAQERQRIAEALLEAAERDREETRRWAERAFEEQRRLADRLTHVYGEARAHGASVDELRQP